MGRALLRVSAEVLREALNLPETTTMSMLVGFTIEDPSIPDDVKEVCAYFTRDNGHVRFLRYGDDDPYKQKAA